MKIESKKKKKTRAMIARVDEAIHKEANKIRKKHGHTWVGIMNAGLSDYIHRMGPVK